MDKRLLLVFSILLTQSACEYGDNLYPYREAPLTYKVQSELEQQKRDFLKIEDLKVGKGPVAAWGRRFRANIKAMHADGTVIYKGPIVTSMGFDLPPQFLHEDDPFDDLASRLQRGIWLGLNGMAVGGRRRITISPEYLNSGSFLDKKTLLVEATLTESCVPVQFRIVFGIVRLVDTVVGCRNKPDPRSGGSDSHIY